MINYTWLRNYKFDTFFVFGIALLALSVGIASLSDRSMFDFLFLANLWLLGYHHVISTFTRIAFDAQSRKENFFLLYPLPVAILGTTFLLSLTQLQWLIPTIYLYWQWFHYTRQSYGVSRFYQAMHIRNNPDNAEFVKYWNPINTVALYSVPLLGIMHRSWQPNERFLTMEIMRFPVNDIMLYLMAAIAVIAVSAQMVLWFMQYRKHSLPGSYVNYIMSHYIIFFTGYIAVENIDYGWVILNIWHNLQYITFVWMRNNMDAKRAGESSKNFIMKISQDNMVAVYFGVCLLLTLFAYSLIKAVTFGLQGYFILPIVLLVYMSINFHHYVVDSVIWTRKYAKKKA